MRPWPWRCVFLVALMTPGCAPPATTAAGPGPAPVVSPSATPYRELVVRALLDLNGAQASSARSVQAGLEVAVEDVNTYLAAQQATFRFKLLVEDDGSSNDVALARLQSLDAQGVKLVVGSDSSESLAYIKDYANQHGIVLISPCSTAPSLAIEDNVIRTAPADVLQARALTMLLRDQGVHSLLTLYRDDTWGRELNTELGYSSTVFSMALDASQSYPTTSTDYSGAVASLSLAVSQAIAREGTSSVAVGLLSFDEARNVFLAAKDDPVLKAVRWFGCDGNALSPALTADAAAAAFAAQTNFLASTFLNPFDSGNPNATRSAFVSPFGTTKAKIQAKLGGTPTEYAYTAYDSLWLAGLAARQLDGFPEASQVVDAIWHAAYDFRGTSGAMNLSPEGDRTTGDYGFFGVQGNAWVRRAIYHAGIGSNPQATGSLEQLTY